MFLTTSSASCIPDADRVFDLSRGITFLDKKLEQLFPPEDDEFAPKVVDKLAQVYTHDGNSVIEYKDTYLKIIQFW